METSFVLSLEKILQPNAPLIVAVSQSNQYSRVTPQHQHAGGQLFGAMRGLLSVETPNNHWVVPATHAVWIPPDVPHALRSHGPFEGWSVYVAPTASTDLPLSPCIVSAQGLLRETVNRALTWNTDGLDAAQQRIAEVILDEIRTLPHQLLGLPLPQDARLLKVVLALIHEPADGRSLEMWAEWVAIAPRTMTRRFVTETGFTFTEWRQRVRLLRALELLASGQAVTTVALALGYDNSSSFIALFKRTFGKTPGRYSP